MASRAPEASDLLQAIELLQNYQLAFWDAQVVQSAMHPGYEQLLSIDLGITARCTVQCACSIPSGSQFDAPIFYI